MHFHWWWSCLIAKSLQVVLWCVVVVRRNALRSSTKWQCQWQQSRLPLSEKNRLTVYNVGWCCCHRPYLFPSHRNLWQAIHMKATRKTELDMRRRLLLLLSVCPCLCQGSCCNADDIGSPTLASSEAISVAPFINELIPYNLLHIFKHILQGRDIMD